MNLFVVVTAQQHEIRELGLATIMAVVGDSVALCGVNDQARSAPKS